MRPDVEFSCAIAADEFKFFKGVQQSQRAGGGELSLLRRFGEVYSWMIADDGEEL